MKKLPNLFTNSFDKKIDNSLEYVKITEKKFKKKYTLNQINKKIDNIFKSKNYIYKIKVKLSLENKELETYIIGKTKTYLITLENKLIKINEINNIEEII